ncbi:MAG: FAD-binding oxidoreductase, partial [Ensifer adhaerens]|nr:FAD-binding oxidoreductase [Ensifer adhaerens]
MTLQDHESWGRIDNRVRPGISPDDYEDRLGSLEAEGYLPFGNGRSYGDSCHNDQGHLIESNLHGRILAFDPGTGMITCEAGVTLRQVLERAIEHRFFLPVTPGTAFVTVGGAVANDV